MKLKNKKTGEIITTTDFTFATYDDGIRYNGIQTYNSLEEFNEDWEDYEEPKTIWFIDNDFGICHRTITGEDEDYITKWKKETGNYFETLRQAEEAVEKLKAWKRLKDKGFKFINYNCPLREIYFEVDEENFFGASGEASKETCADLAILFGGGDD